MTSTSIPPKPKYLCPKCCNYCENDTNCISCDQCSNLFHLQCTKFSKKHLIMMKRNGAKFTCEICNDKKHCDKCNLSVSSYPKGIYCVNCLEFSCMGCVPLSNDEVHTFLTTKQPYFCKQCFEHFYCPSCDKLCEDNEGAEPSILCNCCNRWMHLKCSKLRLKQFNKLGRCSDPYFCGKCIQNNLPFTKISGNDFAKNVMPSGLSTPSVLSRTNTDPCCLCIECHTDCDKCSNCPDLYRTCDNCLKCETIDPISFNKMTSKRSNDELLLTHFNMRSLKKNIHKIREFLYPLDKIPEIICVTETKLNEGPIVKGEIGLQGYKFFDVPTKSCFGGSGIYVSENLSSITKQRKDLDINLPGEFEATFIEIAAYRNQTKTRKSKNLIIGSLYRHPHENHDEFYEVLAEKLTKLGPNLNIILLGDLNIDFSSQNTVVKEYKNFLLSFGLRNYITNVATRIGINSETTIDHVVSNLQSNQIKAGVIQYEATDHFPIFGIPKLILPFFNTEPPIYRRFFNKNKKDDFCHRLQSQLQDNGNSSDTNFDPEISLGYVMKSIQAAYDETFPLKKLSRKARKRFRKPWVTASIIDSIMLKHKLYKAYSRRKTAHNFNAYKKQRNLVKRNIESAKRKYYLNLFDQSKNDVRKTWKNIKIVQNKATCAINTLPKQICSGVNSSTTDPVDVANKLNEHFVHKGPKLSSKIRACHSYKKYLKARNPHNMVFFKIKKSKIVSLLSGLKLGKAPGHDGISAQILKWCIPYISAILCKIFNKCVHDGIYPDVLKIAKVTALHKGGDMTDADNFRPISILPQINKIFEKLIHQRLLSFLKKYKILSAQQFGFLKRHSTSHSLTCLYEKLIQNLENKLDTAVLFVDLKAAFDTVDNEILIDKLEHYGIRYKTLKLLTSYLHNRKQFVKCGQIESTVLSVLCGVPQGSVLGPLLFILYINDIFNCSSFDPVLYADDAALIISAKTLKKLNQNIKKESNSFFEWLNANKLTLNYKKTKYMIVTNKNYTRNFRKKFRLNINKNNIKQVDIFKYLGIILDNSLSWKPHIEYLQSKLSSASGIMFRTRKYMPSPVLRLVYNSLVDSYLRYGIASWGTAAAYLCDRLQASQNRVLKSLLPNSTSVSDLTSHYKRLKILNIENLFKINIGKFVHSIYHGYNPPAFDSSIPLCSHTYSTRHAQNAHFALAHPRTETGKKAIGFAGVKCWTDIPTYIKILKNTKSFNSALKDFLLT